MPSKQISATNAFAPWSAHATAACCPKMPINTMKWNIYVSSKDYLAEYLYLQELYIIYPVADRG